MFHFTFHSPLKTHETTYTVQRCWQYLCICYHLLTNSINSFILVSLTEATPTFLWKTYTSATVADSKSYTFFNMLFCSHNKPLTSHPPSLSVLQNHHWPACLLIKQLLYPSFTEAFQLLQIVSLVSYWAITRN